MATIPAPALAEQEEPPFLIPALQLAWSLLIHDWRRLILSASGIGCAVILMFVQYGCLNALLDSNLLLLDKLNADLVLVSSKHRTLATPESFPEQRLRRVSGIPGVASVQPLAIEYTRSRLRNLDNPADSTLDGPEGTRYTGKPGHSIRVLGINPDSYPLLLPELNPDDPKAAVHRLDKPGAVLFDARSKRASGSWGRESIYGKIEQGKRTELAQRTIEIVGTFNLGSDFGTDGTLIVSRDTFARWLRRPFSELDPYHEIEMGLIRLRKGANPRAVQQAIAASFPEGDVEVLTVPQMKSRESAFWLHNTPIGGVFGMGMAMGFLVGLVICYQILASGVLDNLAQYATLKAIGSGNTFLVASVMWQAVLLAALGFLPGLLLSWLIYLGMAALTDLPMALNPYRIGLVMSLTLFLCLLSGVLALSGVLGADPAEVFS